MKVVRNKEPFYIQVKNELKKRILKGIYPKNTFLPPEPALEKEFGVSKITIRRAVEQLAHEGYVEKQSGVGTRILDNRAIIRLSTGQGFTEYLLSKGFSLEKTPIAISMIDPAIDARLTDLFQEDCYRIERLYLLDGQPYIHFTHYIPSRFSLPLNREVFKESLYEILHEKGASFHRFQDEFGLQTPNEEIAKLLKIKPKPLFQRIRYSYDIHQQLIEYSIGYYHTKLHNYVVNLTV